MKYKVLNHAQLVRYFTYDEDSHLWYLDIYSTETYGAMIPFVRLVTFIVVDDILYYDRNLKMYDKETDTVINRHINFYKEKGWIEDATS